MLHRLMHKNKDKSTLYLSALSSSFALRVVLLVRALNADLIRNLSIVKIKLKPINS